jgi:hypothetical protein
MGDAFLSLFKGYKAMGHYHESESYIPILDILICFKLSSYSYDNFHCCVMRAASEKARYRNMLHGHKTLPAMRFSEVPSIL